MKFTNDINFNQTPTSNKILNLTYTGNLFKNNSNEVYIVYGFGENWDNTTEQKMNKTDYGFETNIKIENYNTFNFCFRNSNYVWDNNDSFNYISSISAETTCSELENLSTQEANNICSKSIDNIINSISLDLENNEIETIESTEETSVLDSLIQELFEEYSAQNNSTSLSEQSIQTYSPSNETPISITESEFDKFFEEIKEIEEPSNAEFFSELSELFDEIINNIETQEKTIQEIDVGKELNTVFENTFTENFESQNEIVENYIPEKATENFSVDIDNSELNKTFSDIVKNISKVKTETNSEADDLNYDYSDFNEMFAFAQNLNNENIEEEKIFDFTNLDFDFEMNKIEENNTEIVTEQTTTVSTSNKFSDSFYDDEDITIHENYTNFQDIVNSITTELEQEVEKTNLFENTDLTEKENAEFEAAINEYTQYFDNLIEEIVSTSTNTLSTTVSTAQIIENENSTSAVINNENENIATSSSDTTTEISTDAVPDEYALYDYKSHSFFYMFKRNFKRIISTLFNKLPKLFGSQQNTENN